MSRNDDFLTSDTPPPQYSVRWHIAWPPTVCPALSQPPVRYNSLQINSITLNYPQKPWAGMGNYVCGNCGADGFCLFTRSGVLFVGGSRSKYVQPLWTPLGFPECVRVSVSSQHYFEFIHSLVGWSIVFVYNLNRHIKHMVRAVIGVYRTFFLGLRGSNKQLL